jgi:hypothetical protein
MVSEHACPLPFVTPPLLSLSLSSLFSYYWMIIKPVLYSKGIHSSASQVPKLFAIQILFIL